jgi:hypothetical protein
MKLQSINSDLKNFGKEAIRAILAEITIPKKALLLFIIQNYNFIFFIKTGAK